MLKRTYTIKNKTTQFTDKGRITAVRPIHIASDLSWSYGEDVVVYDIRERNPYVSYFIVASASSDRRLRALEAHAKESLFDNYKDVDHTEGRNESQWILIDAHDVVVQLFTKEERKRVDLDALYADCPHKVVKATEEPKYRKKKRPASQMNMEEEA